MTGLLEAVEFLEGAEFEAVHLEDVGEGVVVLALLGEVEEFLAGGGAVEDEELMAHETKVTDGAGVVLGVSGEIATVEA